MQLKIVLKKRLPRRTKARQSPNFVQRDTNLHGFREDIDLYAEIRQLLPNLTNILKDMNTLTVQTHKESGFEALFNAIENKLSG